MFEGDFADMCVAVSMGWAERSVVHAKTQQQGLQLMPAEFLYILEAVVRSTEAIVSQMLPHTDSCEIPCEGGRGDSLVIAIVNPIVE
jgi:hypothetical protein